MSTAERNLELNALINYHLVKEGYKKKELATLLHMCPASLYNKLNNIGSFTFDELIKLWAVLKIPKEKFAALI